jgi:hypothetical protein
VPDDAYRKSKRKRREIVRFAMPAFRVAGVVCGIVFALMSYGVSSRGERDSRLQCERTSNGEGTCTRTVRYITHVDVVTFPVTELRGARVETSHGRGGAVSRTVLEVGTSEISIASNAPKEAQTITATAIDQFARTSTTVRIDETWATDVGVAVFTSLMLALSGSTLVFTAFLLTSPRRLVLDEEAEIATLEKRSLMRWQKVWAVPLKDVERVRASSGQIVIDTKTDGLLVAVPSAREDDPAVAAIQAFLEA